MMYSTFESLNIKKQERIINAAMKEFVHSGFERASTNVIVEEANISKGSLFNYFHNKKELYLFLIDQSKQVIAQVYEHVDWAETDIFQRIEQIGHIKLDIFKKYPLVFDFLKAAVTEHSELVREEIHEKLNEIFDSGLDRIYENIDCSKFRDDIDIQKAIEIINWTMIGFGEKERNQLSSFEEVDNTPLNTWKDYADILKSSFYKKEGESR